MLRLHIMNSKKRNATISINSLRFKSDIQMGVPGSSVTFQRYLQAMEGGLHDVLQSELGEDYGQQLVDGDPEVDIEEIGRFIPSTDTVYLSGEGEVLHAAPQIVEVLLDTGGKECDRREPVDAPGNVHEEVPVVWTGRKMPKSEVACRFAFARTIQLQHVDGLTYDFLYEMAKELAEENVLVLIGAGKDGKDPLTFQTNGTPYRGFMEGRVDGDRYKLLLHLSNMELKRDSDGFNPRFQTKND